MKIKNCILSITFLLPLASIAQNIKIKDQDVFLNDSPYCKISGKTSIKAAFRNDVDFTILSLQGEELIYVKKGADNFFNVTFLADGRSMKYKKSPTAFNIQKDFLKKMIAGKLLQGDTINLAAKEAFRLQKDEDKSLYKEVVSSTANGDYNVVERNLSEPVKVGAENIEQDATIIGTYIISDEVTMDGTSKTVVSFYLPNGTKVAKLDIDNSKAADNEIVTFIDNNLDSIDVLSGDMSTNKSANLKKAAQWLIVRGYL